MLLQYSQVTNYSVFFLLFCNIFIHISKA